MHFYDSIRTLMNLELICKTPAIIEEKDSDVSTAISSIIAGLFGILLKNGNTQQIKNILEEAGTLDILSDIGNICGDTPTADQQRIGDDLLEHLLGDRAADFTLPIADHSHVSKVAANSLISMVAPIVAGYLGNKLVKEHWNMSNLLDEIGKQKDSFLKHIPSSLIRSFDLSSVLEKAGSDYNKKEDYSKTNKAKKKKNNTWIIWLVLILLVLVIFFWRSCSKQDSSSDKGNFADTTEIIATDVVVEQ